MMFIYLDLKTLFIRIVDSRKKHQVIGSNMNKLDTHEGGCLCGGVRYKTEGNPEYVGLCHCRYCQLRTGSAMGISVYFENNLVSINTGETSIKPHEFQTESGGNFVIQFCSNCGTSLFWRLTARPGLVGVGGGTFDPPTFWYEVEREVFCRSKADFIHTDIKDKFVSAPTYQPIKDEAIHLKGG